MTAGPYRSGWGLNTLASIFRVGAYPIGIDLGAGGAKIVQLRRTHGGTCALVAAARVDIDRPGAGPLEPERLEALTEGLRKRVESSGFVGRHCVASVDETVLRVRSVRQPRMPREEADRAVQLEAPDRLGFTPDDACRIGWIRAGEVRQGKETREELILVGAMESELARIIEAVAAAGLRPVAIEPSFAACARCMGRRKRRSEDRETTRLVVDVGRRSTGVMVVRGPEVAFYKLLKMGGDAMNAAAAKRLSMDIPTIAQLRRERMSSAAEAESKESGVRDARVQRAMFDAVRPLLDDLAREVALCLRYYTVTFCGQRPEEALVVGGEAREPGLVEALSRALNMEASVGRPFEHIDVARGALPGDRRTEMPEWATAAGLSMRAEETPTRMKKLRNAAKAGSATNVRASTTAQQALSIGRKAA